MSRIDHAFRHKPIFMPYFPLGYPDLSTSVDAIEALARGGADLVEVGLSFSDPLADGPVIQKATQVALERGITIGKSLRAVGELRRRGVTIPLVLMGYYTPLLAYGLERLAGEAAEAGADAFIVPDLPPEESGELETALADSGLPLIRMLAPTTPPDRMERVARGARGFVYLVSVAGTTGERRDVAADLAGLVSRVRQHTGAPVCVGFGIGTPEQARAVGALADGVIVGSACVRTIGESPAPVEAAEGFAHNFREALKGSRIGEV
jgi:tryptophan synthase alpha chain